MNHLRPCYPGLAAGRFFVYVSLIFCLLTLGGPRVLADDIFIILLKKQEEKKRSRWSLQDWLITKEKMRLMDQWLALNSSQDLFEGFLGGDMGKHSLNFDAASSSSNREGLSMSRGHLGLYLSIFGLEGSYGKSKESFTDWNGSLNLRILGSSVQGTNLTFKVGLRNMDDGHTYQNLFWGGQITLYVLSFLGVEGQYLIYSKDHARDDQSKYLKGNRSELSAFLDIFFLRLYGTWFKEPLTYEDQSGRVTKTRKGVLTGAKIFF